LNLMKRLLTRRHRRVLVLHAGGRLYNTADACAVGDQMQRRKGNDEVGGVTWYIRRLISSIEQAKAFG
jgi:hypothetical protein